MSIKLTPEDQKLISVLYANRQLERVTAFLERLKQEAVERLIDANPETYQRIQGRAKLLSELVEAFSKTQ